MRAEINANGEQSCERSGGGCGMCAWRVLSVWTIIAGAAVYISQAFLDLRVMAWSQWAGLNPSRDAFQVISGFGSSFWYIAALGALTPIAFLVGWRRLSQRLLFLLVSVLATGLVVQFIKIVAGRHRPKSLVDDGLYGFSWFNFGYETASFPSGHTATMAAVAAAMWIMVPKWRDLWLLPVLAVAASRILLGSHYLSDVIAGAYVGAATAFVVYRTLSWRGAVLSRASRSRPMMTSVSQSPVE